MSGEGMGVVGDFFLGAFRDDTAAEPSASGAYVDHPIRTFDDGQMMFHHQDCIPFCDGLYGSLPWEKEKGYRGYISSQGTRLKCL